MQKYVLHFAVQPPVLFEFDDYRLSKSAACSRAQVSELDIAINRQPFAQSFVYQRDAIERSLK